MTELSSTPPSSRELPEFTLAERMIAAVCSIAVAVAWTAVAGAWLAARLTGSSLGVSGFAAIEAIAALGDHLGDPAQAWPEPARSRLPGAPLYWISTVAAGLPPSAAAWWWLRRGQRRRLGLERRVRLGVDAEARMALLADIAPIVVDGPTPGRFILGTVHGRLVATEAPGPRPTGPLPRRARGGGTSRPVRGAVMLVAPSQAGKSSMLISGLLDWQGPAIASSVKVDLIAETRGWRSQVGATKVYDPVSVTGLPRASWSPLRGAETWSGAQAASHAVRSCAPASTGEHANFFDQQMEMLLAGYLWVAANAGRSMRDVNRWVASQDGADPDSEVAALLVELFHDSDPAVRLAADYAATTLSGIWCYEERTRSNIFATVQGGLWPWTNPEVVGASEHTDVTLDWLLAGDNTLYVAAPLDDAERLAPAIGGLLADLLHQVASRCARTGTPLDPPLLLILDEIGNTPLRNLAKVLSTLSGLGVQIVTAWQSIAQIHSCYGRTAGTVIANHRTKVFYSGISDGETGDLTNKLLGDEQVLNRQVTSELGVDGGRRSLLEASVTTGLVPAHVLRQQRTGSALLIHGTIPAAHLTTRSQFDDPDLFAKASLPWRTPADDNAATAAPEPAPRRRGNVGFDHADDDSSAEPDSEPVDVDGGQSDADVESHARMPPLRALTGDLRARRPAPQPRGGTSRRAPPDAL